MGDDELIEVEEPKPSEQSLIRKARKKMEDSKLIEAVIRWGVVAALGIGGGYATGTVGDAKKGEHDAITHAELATLRQELREFRDGLLSRVETEEKERLAVERVADERRHAREQYRERRFTRIEGKLGLEAPSARVEEE